MHRCGMITDNYCLSNLWSGFGQDTDYEIPTQNQEHFSIVVLCSNGGFRYNGEGYSAEKVS